MRLTVHQQQQKTESGLFVFLSNFIYGILKNIICTLRVLFFLFYISFAELIIYTRLVCIRYIYAYKMNVAVACLTSRMA